MNKIFLFLILFSHTFYGCALCTLYSPETKVAIEIKADHEKIKSANITWVLTKEFTEQLKQIYDENQNNFIDKDELKPIEQSLLDYIKPKDFLTHISYGKIIDKENSEDINIKEYKTYIKNSLLHFTYILDLNYEVIKDNALYININDDENYFILLLAINGVKFSVPFKHKEVLSRQSMVLYIDQNEVRESTIKEIKKTKDDKKVKEERSEVIEKEKTLLSSFSKKVKEYLLKIQNGDSYALFILLGVSFLYGIIHALGPGHGKSLAFTYFSSNKSSYLKAFWISQASAFIHIIGALILVIVSVFLLQSFLNSFVKDSVEILTKISSIMIMTLAIYILYNKLNHNKCACNSCSSVNQNPIWSIKNPNANINLKPKFVKKDLYFVLTAGLIPCPGTVVLFIYAFVLKTYFAVLLASIFISLGMGLVIFLSSFIGVSIHNLSSKSHKITNFLEILAPIIMFILGILLFLNADII
ncbi:MAG: DUF1007 domain-containing protein [Arcobacter sp.]|nr:MAG: DUF1007 domain-containing protein [Arcobacter sp.]